MLRDLSATTTRSRGGRTHDSPPAQPLRISLGGRRHGTALLLPRTRRLVLLPRRKYVYLRDETFSTRVPNSSMRTTEVVQPWTKSTHPISFARPCVCACTVGVAPGGGEACPITPRGTGWRSSGQFHGGAIARATIRLTRDIRPTSFWDRKQACHSKCDILSEPLGKQDQYLPFGVSRPLSFAGMAACSDAADMIATCVITRGTTRCDTANPVVCVLCTWAGSSHRSAWPSSPNRSGGHGGARRTAEDRAPIRSRSSGLREPLTKCARVDRAYAADLRSFAAICTKTGRDKQVPFEILTMTRAPR